jgi:hypothetical protein
MRRVMLLMLRPSRAAADSSLSRRGAGTHTFICAVQHCSSCFVINTGINRGVRTHNVPVFQNEIFKKRRAKKRSDVGESSSADFPPPPVVSGIARRFGIFGVIVVATSASDRGG